MTAHRSVKLLDAIDNPADLRRLEEGQLAQVAEEVRQTVIEAVSQTGGHLGAGLGVCELTVALHYLFDTPKDKLVWDVSHQCYPHKTLTGRKDRLTTLRQGGGLSGFTSREESEYDPFGAAHSSTAISAAVGFAQARDYKGEDGHVIAVVGDGAMTAGMAYEGLNNAGYLKTRMIVILNDNNMSIAPPAGALSDYLTRLRKTLPETDERRQALEKAALKSFVNDTTMFEDLGVKYVGPIDGHDMGELLATLKAAKEYEEGPVLIHCLTRKGKGYAPAEASADCYHGVVKFDVDSGKQHKPAPAAPAYTKVFAKALIDAAKKDDTICAVSAAMPGGTGLDLFGKEFPDRTFDVGIAEQHAVTFCGGLAAEGFKPFAAIYSTFLQRGYDQVVHDIAIQKLPVRFAIDRAGMVGADGVTHQGSYDIAYLGCLPNFVLMAPGDEAELVHMVATACAIDDRPSALRYPRGEGLGLELPAEGVPLEIGKGRIMREGTKVAILSYGSRLGDSLLAAEELDAKGIPTTVADARFAKPIDTDLVTRLAREHEVLITVEEASIGGFAAQVTHHLTHTGLLDGALKFRPMYLPDRFIDHGKPQAQIEQAGLAAPDIVAMAVRALGFEAATPIAATGE